MQDPAQAPRGGHQLPRKRRGAGCLVAAVALVGALSLLTIDFKRITRPSTSAARAGVYLSEFEVSPPPSGPHDWSFYRDFYEDLRNLTLSQAEQHYWAAGRADGRLAVPFRIQLEYRVSSGLCNQLYAHVHALLIAHALATGAAGVVPPPRVVEVVLPPAWQRSSFDSLQSITWSNVSVSTLLDVGSMAAYWAPRNVSVRPTPEVLSLQAVPGPGQQEWKAEYARPPEGHCIAASVDMPRRAMMELPAYLRRLKVGIEQAAQPLLQEDPARQIPCFYLDLGNTIFAINTQRLLGSGEAGEVAQGLFFNRTLGALADEIIAAMDPQQQGFDGLHLRTEGDTKVWTNQLEGGMQEILGAYYKAMRAAGYNGSSVVYTASGLLSSNDTDGWPHVVAQIKERGLASAVMHKEQLLGPSRLAGLFSEQLALLDLLVLLRSNRLVGFGPSSFSYLLMELRALQGRPKSTATLINPVNLSLTFFKTSGRLSD